MVEPFIGAAKRIDNPGDIIRIATREGWEPALLQGVVYTEAGKSGFDKKGRLKALFEPHRFFKELKGNKTQLARAIKEGLAYEDWIPGNYPDDSYPRIRAAMAINPEAALRATSWGMGQVLGSNCLMTAHATADAMVRAFADDEENQLEGMVSFIKERGLSKAMRDANYEAIAAGYNGKKFRAHGYHTKIRNAHLMFRKKNVSAPPAVKAPAPNVSVPLGSNSRMNKLVQERLVELGYFVKVDGDYGPRTRAAILAVEADMGWPLTGQIIAETLFQLDSARQRDISTERANMTASELSDTSRIIRKTGVGEKAAVGLGVVGAVTEVSKVAPENVTSALDGVLGILTPLQSIKEFAGDHWGMLAIALGIGAWLIFSQIRAARVEDHQTGKTP